jgi:DNA invertase Pin-like site-specific DNA recombinase
MSRQVGYGRVSTEDQHLDGQRAELTAAGCQIIFEEQRSGADRSRPELARALREIRAGDVMVVVRMDRLARSLSHLLSIMEELKGRGAFFRSLRDPIDTTSAHGMLQMQMLGAFAEFERRLIADRVTAGMKAAKARGKIPGNPGLKAGDKAAIAKLVKARDTTHVRKLIDRMETFMPTVRRMRPGQPWGAVAKALNQTGGSKWTVDRLKRNVRRLAAEGMIDKALLGRATPPRRRRTDELVILVRGFKLADPSITPSAIARQLELMKLVTPAGKANWSPQSVVHLLNKLPPGPPGNVS